RLLGRRASRDAPVQPALAELGLALRVEVQVPAVRLEHVDDLETAQQRVGEVLGPDEVEVVSRAVVSDELAVQAAGEDADRQVESRRAELALVPAPRV